MAKNITITGTNFLDTITVEGITYKTVYDAIKANVVTEDEILEIFEELKEEEEEINDEIYEDFGFCIVEGYICTDPWDIQKKIKLFSKKNLTNSKTSAIL